MYFQKERNFLVRFNFLFCVEDHHSPLESDLTRSFCTADRHLPLENAGNSRIVLFVLIFKSTSILI